MFSKDKLFAMCWTIGRCKSWNTFSIFLPNSKFFFTSLPPMKRLHWRDLRFFLASLHSLYGVTLYFSGIREKCTDLKNIVAILLLICCWKEYILCSFGFWLCPVNCFNLVWKRLKNNYFFLGQIFFVVTFPMYRVRSDFHTTNKKHYRDSTREASLFF